MVKAVNVEHGSDDEMSLWQPHKRRGTLGSLPQTFFEVFNTGLSISSNLNATLHDRQRRTSTGRPKRVLCVAVRIIDALL
jgi:hypothetical protein